MYWYGHTPSGKGMPGYADMAILLNGLKWFPQIKLMKNCLEETSALGSFILLHSTNENYPKQLDRLTKWNIYNLCLDLVLSKIQADFLNHHMMKCFP